MVSRVAIIVVCVLVCAGCDKQSASEEGETSDEAKVAEEQAKPDQAEPASEGEQAEQAEQAAAKSEDDESDSDETDGQSSNTLEIESLPEQLVTDNMLDSGLEWTDKKGKNFFVFDLKTSKVTKSKTEQVTNVALAATHWRKPTDDGEWKEVRTFKERIDQCNWDAGISPMLGDWSLTDLDDDGINEVTFAYGYGCGSDASGGYHKVLIVEDGEKSVLRGKAVLTVPGEDELGTVDEAVGFEDTSESFRTHADDVWNKTSDVRKSTKFVVGR